MFCFTKVLSIEINDSKDINEDEYKKITDIIVTLNSEKDKLEWLVETTEKFCKDRGHTQCDIIWHTNHRWQR